MICFVSFYKDNPCSSQNSCDTKYGHGCCVFPFTYEDKKFTSCTPYGHKLHYYWSAYIVDNTGIMEEWKLCKDSCKHIDFRGT